MERSNETFTKFMEILNKITKEELETEEDKTKNYWEKALIDSWERLIDRDEDKNYDFFVVKENLLTEIRSAGTKALEEETKSVEVPLEKETSSVVETESKGGLLKKELQENY